MDDQQKSLEQKNLAEGAEASSPAVLEGEVLDTSLDLGEVAESLGESKENEKPVAASSTTQKDESKAVDPVEKEALKTRLLDSAPKAAVMRKQILDELETQKNNLEKSVRKHRQRGEFRQLSLVLAELRKLIRLIEDVAHAGYEQLKDFWIKIVHHFA